MIPGVGTRARDTEAGRARIAAALARYVEYCEQTETPWCPMGSNINEVEAGEPVGATS